MTPVYGPAITSSTPLLCQKDYESPFESSKADTAKHTPPAKKEESTDSSTITKSVDDLGLLTTHSFFLNRNNFTFEECFAYLQAQHTWVLLDQPNFKEVFIQVVDKKGRSLLMRALKSRCYSLAERLIKTNIGLTTRDSKGNNCLHFAAKYGSVELVDKIRKYLDVNIKNNKLHTPLYSAIKKGAHKVVQYLVDKGANTEIFFSYKNKSLTPLDFAKVMKAPKCVQILEKRQVVFNLLTSKGLVEYQFFDKAVKIRIRTSFITTEFQILKENGCYISIMQYLVKGSFYYQAGNFLKAANHFCLAMEPLSAVLGELHSGFIGCLCMIADCFFHEKKFDEARCKYIDALNLLNKIPQNFLQERGECFKSIGCCYLLEYNYEEARRQFYKALKLFSEMPQDLYFNKGRCFSFIGLCYFREQNYNEARYQFHEALKLSNELRHDLVQERGKCYQLIGICYLMEQNYIEARYQCHEALQRFKVELKAEITESKNVVCRPFIAPSEVPTGIDALTILDSDISDTLRDIELCDQKINRTGCSIQ